MVEEEKYVLTPCGCLMGEKAHKALNDCWSWIEAYMEGEQDE